MTRQPGRRGALPPPGDIDQDWGPTVRGRARRRRPVRTLLLVLLLVLVLTAAALLWFSSRIPRIDVDGLAATGRPLHILVVGSDSREELTPEQRRELSTGAAEGERTDTIFLMTVQGSDVALLAFPRDLWVERCDGSAGRINAAVQISGPSCLVTTVRQLSGIDVHHFVRVTFAGFVDIVDAVDGVELCLDEAISDRDAGIDLPAGCQVLDGPDALGYVRVRKIDDDLHRIERQQQFLKALASDVASPSTLNPIRFVRLSNEVGDAIGVDRGMGILSMARAGLGARGLVTGEAGMHTIPVVPHRTGGGASVLLVREAEAEALFARFRDGSILAERQGTDGLVPADVEVSVLNGAGVEGLAGEVARALETRGYRVTGVGNAELRDTTVVRHPPGEGPAARLVASELPGGAQVEEATEVTGVALVLGRDAIG